MTKQQTAPQNRGNTFKDLSGYLARRKPEIASMLPKTFHGVTGPGTFEKLMSDVQIAVANNPAILNCSFESVMSAIYKAAVTGLNPSGVDGFAYLIPYKTSCVFVPGYKGLMDLVRRSGEFQYFHAYPVYENDYFHYSLGLRPDLVHEPPTDPEANANRGEIVWFYAVATTKDGFAQFEVMTRGEVEGIRDRSSGYQAFKAGYIKTTPWETDFVQMGRKTLIRRLSNYLPISNERLLSAFEAMDSEVGPVEATYQERPAPTPPANRQNARREQRPELEPAPTAVNLGETERPQYEHASESQNPEKSNERAQESETAQNSPETPSEPLPWEKEQPGNAQESPTEAPKPPAKGKPRETGKKAESKGESRPEIEQALDAIVLADSGETGTSYETALAEFCSFEYRNAQGKTVRAKANELSELSDDALSALYEQMKEAGRV